MSALAVYLLASTTHHRGVGFGIVLVVIGVFDLVFRRFYARRSAAVQNARRETAPGPLRRFYWRGDESAYLRLGWVVSTAMILGGIAYIVTA